MVVAGHPRIGDLLAGGGTKILNEGCVLLPGALRIAGAWLAAKLKPGFRTYDARNPVPSPAVPFNEEEPCTTITTD